MIVCSKHDFVSFPLNRLVTHAWRLSQESIGYVSFGGLLYHVLEVLVAVARSKDPQGSAKMWFVEYLFANVLVLFHCLWNRPLESTEHYCTETLWRQYFCFVYNFENVYLPACAGTNEVIKIMMRSKSRLTSMSIGFTAPGIGSTTGKQVFTFKVADLVH